MSAGAPALSLTTTLDAHAHELTYNPFADARAHPGPYSAVAPSPAPASGLRPRRRGSEGALGRAPPSPTAHARAHTLDMSASGSTAYQAHPTLSPARHRRAPQRAGPAYLDVHEGDEEEEAWNGEGRMGGEGEDEDEDHPLRRRSSSRSVRSAASTKPRLRAALRATMEGEEEGEQRARRARARAREEERQPQRAVLIHQVTPSDSLQGVALRYGIALADLRKANQLWAHDSIHLRTTLLVPLDQARHAKLAFVDAAASASASVDLLSPLGDGAPLSASPDAHAIDLLGPDTSEESNISGASSGRARGTSVSAAQSPPTRPAHSHAATESDVGAAPAPGLTVTRVPASRLAFFPPPAPPKPRARASAELGRASAELSRAQQPAAGRARAGSDLLPSAAPAGHGHGRARTEHAGATSPARAHGTDYFALLTPTREGAGYFPAPAHAPPDALAHASKSIGRAAGRAAGWLADALAIPLPAGASADAGLELDRAGAGAGKGRARAARKGAPAPWFAPPAPPSPAGTSSAGSSPGSSPFVPPRATNRRVARREGGAEDGEGGGVLGGSAPMVRAQPEARRAMVVPAPGRR